MKTLCTALVLFLYAFAYGQNAEWLNFNLSNSIMPSNQVNAIAVDSQGVKWITAENGFVKMVDTVITVYDANNSEFKCPHPTGVTIDKNGLVWIATYCQGIVKFDGTTFTVYDQYHSPLPYSTVTGVAVCKNNNKWMGMQLGGVAKFNGTTTWNFYNISNSVLPSNDVRAVTVNTLTNDKWFATDNGIARFDGISSWSVYDTSNSDLPGNDVKTIQADKNGYIWIGTDGDGLAKFDNGTWTVYNTINSGIRSNRIVSLSMGSKPNEMWVGTYSGGLQKFDGTAWVAYNTLNSPLLDNRITAVLIDKLGNKWIGTYAHGLYAYNETGIALPVELVSFTSEISGNNVKLNWTTASELNTSHYLVERRSKTSGWEVIAQIKASGSSTEKLTYTYVDKELSNGIYTYRLKMTDFDNSFEYSNETESIIASAGDFILNQNYPNPFNPSTKITYRVPESGSINLKIVSMLGETVREINQTVTQGVHEITLDGSNLSSGTYIYTLTAKTFDGKNTFTSSGKMMLMK